MVLKVPQLLLLLYITPTYLQECTILDKPFNCDAIIQILEYHNEMRSKVARGNTKLQEAMNMWALKWDNSLAALAQDWANKCTLKPNSGRPNDVGENLAWQTISQVGPIDVENIIEMWYDEIHNYNQDLGGVQEGAEHFTQLIWGDSKFVGCGATIFQEGEDIEVYQILVVCNYKPAGNYINQLPYAVLDRSLHDNETGEVIRCKRGIVSSKYHGLCAHDIEHSQGTYNPCASFGNNSKPTACFWTLLLLCGLYDYIFLTT